MGGELACSGPRRVYGTAPAAVTLLRRLATLRDVDQHGYRICPGLDASTMPTTVFYSWQLDRPAKTGRNLIERALLRAIASLRDDIELEEPVRAELEVDRDTKGVAGTPPIVDTIFAKIDAASIFVPDLTFAGHRVDGRPTPNPNVLIEYGWALKQHGHGRMVPVMNIAHGKPSSETLPFDMQHLRHPIQYDCPDNADDATRSAAQATLVKTLAGAIRDILKGLPVQEERNEAAHPETIEEAVPVVKKYCRDDALALEWTELLAEEGRRVRAAVDAIEIPNPLTNEYLSDVFDRLSSISGKTMVMLALCARWGTPEAVKIGLRAIRSLGMRTERRGGYQCLNEMRDLPASLSFYAMLIGALDRQDYVLGKMICDASIVQEGTETPFVAGLPMQVLITGTTGWKFLKGFERRKLPHSEPLFLTLKSAFDALGVDQSHQQRSFDEMEAALTIEFAHRRFQKIKNSPMLWFWTIFGEYLFRSHGDSSTALHRKTAERAEMISAGWFGGTQEDAQKAADASTQLLKESSIMF